MLHKIILSVFLFSFTLLSAQVLPIAVDDSLTTSPNTPINFSVVDNDSLAPNSAVNVLQSPTSGTVLLNLDGTCTYTPDPSFEGIDEFVYVICIENPDSTYACDTATVYITVIQDNYNLHGNVYLDVNGSCVVDSNDSYYSNANIIIQDTSSLQLYNIFTNNLGEYYTSLPNGTYEVLLNMNSYMQNQFQLVCPSNSVFITIDSLNDSTSIDFYLQPTKAIDLEVDYVLGVMRPGFPFIDYINYRNLGYSNMSGSVELTYDPLLTPSTSNTGIVDTTTNTITWSFSDLDMSGNYIHINPIFDSLDVSIPLGTMICNSVIISPVVGDDIPANNVDTVCRFVVGSYDPNQKMVYPEGAISPEKKTHQYHIDFQNLGTYQATFVVVRDNLDDNLDLSTLRNISSSHNFVLTVENGDELVFTFDNIFLAAAQDDEEGSKGSIDFTIDQVADLSIGTEIENTAEIYFDFNEAIITNTTYNIIEKATDIEVLEADDTFSIYPNPSTGIFNINAFNQAINSIKVFDLMGKELLNVEELNSNRAVLNLDEIASGIYIVRIEGGNGSLTKRIVIEK